MSHTSGFWELLIVGIMVLIMYLFLTGQSCSEVLDFSHTIQVYPRPYESQI